MKKLWRLAHHYALGIYFAKYLIDVNLLIVYVPLLQLSDCKLLN